ncbi:MULTISPECIES: rRNA maturation RNase YbeY [Exiguobacterium]|uniref:rRNA maturation RNase YbeY n=1 Tax=Exiguobacterium TaxID=33986 RepID=UPI0008778251|nr:MULTISPECIES: rRNA maturation RNase YbeY [Exiguobacterium]OGX80242.1 rRNA maturation RNase YbeY [Exiguobacterium sp. SH31]TCI47737.1 rRNA maturation RNase YbeY [Exiguobacterium sp. SH5S32]TCI54621.1 rRNA maturation RNase YbeY [Exiguobacterium sp. SH1S4]TCI56467.1 rRNA maturation RNase YbeY [Exiguobacterium sp. SH1S21]TCI74417.1 rRNA maturation RNase YbeY [Exiguobacterium sp. SH1S1]
MQIISNDEQGLLTESQLELVESILVHAALAEQVEEPSELSVTFLTNDEIQVINQEWRGKDAPTDVISFAFDEMGEEEMDFMLDEDEPRLLGDIVISVERCREQAADYGHSFERELGFLAIHGFLHLLGYDHMTPEEEAEMTARQEQVLAHFELKRGEV